MRLCMSAKGIFLISSLFFLTASYGQGNQLFLIPTDEEVEIPFKLINGFIVVEATLNQKHKVNLLVDTGAENLILFNESIKQQLNIPNGKKITLKGADLSNEVSAEIIRNLDLQLPNANEITRDFIVLDENSMNLSGHLGHPIDGIVGGRIFWSTVMEINYKKQKIILQKKSKFDTPPLRDYREFDLYISSSKPYFIAQITLYDGNTIPIKVLLDTGSSLGFLLFYNTHKDLFLPEYYIEGELGRALGGPITGYISKSKLLNLGPTLHFKHLITNFQGQNEGIDPKVYNDRNGLIGNPILSRFNVIIDYVGAKLYLRPHKNYNEQLDYDKSGLILFASGPQLSTYVVRKIVEGSAADAADIRIGDIIKRVNWLPKSLLTLDLINDKLSRKSGKKIRLVIERDGVRIKKQFKLSDYLESSLNRY